MVQDFTGFLHLVSAFGALAFGAIILFRAKGGVVHKRLGYAYVLCMFLLHSTALLIYRLSGGPNVFHVLAVVSTLTVGLGLFHAIAKRPVRTWLEWHYQWMSWSYVGLLAAFIAETSTRLALPAFMGKWGGASLILFWGIVGFVSAIVFGTGAYLIQRNAPRTNAN